MDVRRAYCSGVDRNVPVVLKPGTAPLDAVSLHDPGDLICLDYKVRCTGWMCPLFSVSDDAEPVPAATTSSRDDRPDAASSKREKRWIRPT